MKNTTGRAMSSPGRSADPERQSQVADSPATTDSGQDASPRLLIGSLHDCSDWLDCCPYASTVHAWSYALGKAIVIAQRCKRWRCRHCGERKVVHFAHRVEAARPNRFVTLTVWDKVHADPRAAYDATRRKLPALTAILRRKLGEWEFFRVLETTRRGWPHYHLIVRSPYVDQRYLSETWDRLTGAKVVDVRAIKKGQSPYWYTVKYLAKQSSVPWTDRRVSWSRGFFPADDFKAGPGLELFDTTWVGLHPSQYFTDNCQGHTIERYSRDAWVFSDRPLPTLYKQSGQVRRTYWSQQFSDEEPNDTF